MQIPTWGRQAQVSVYLNRSSQLLQDALWQNVKYPTVQRLIDIPGCPYELQRSCSLLGSISFVTLFRIRG